MSKVLDDILEQTRLLTNEDRQLLFQELSLLQARASSTEELLIGDGMLMDTPIEYIKNAETGVLHIRFPFVAGWKNTSGWSVMEITQNAQRQLLYILSISIGGDVRAGRTKSQQVTHQ